MSNIEMANVLTKMEHERKKCADDLLLYTLHEEGWRSEHVELFVSSECSTLRTMVLTNLRSRLENAKTES